MLEYLSGNFNNPKGSILLLSSYAHQDPQNTRGIPVLVGSAMRGRLREILGIIDREMSEMFIQKTSNNDAALWPVFLDDESVTYNMPSFTLHTNREIAVSDDGLRSICDIVKISPIAIPNLVSQIFESALTLYMNAFVQSRYKIFAKRSKRHYTRESSENVETFIRSQLLEISEARKQRIEEWEKDTILNLQSYLKGNALNTILQDVIREKDQSIAELRMKLLLCAATGRYERAAEIRDLIEKVNTGIVEYDSRTIKW